MVGNLWKAQKRRACLARILGREGDIPRVLVICVFTGGSTFGDRGVGHDPLHSMVPGGGFGTGSHNRSGGGNQSGKWMGVKNTRRWIRKFRRLGLMIWGIMF